MKPYTLNRVCSLDAGYTFVIEYIDPRYAEGCTADAVFVSAEEESRYIVMNVAGFFSAEWEPQFFAKAAYNRTWRAWPYQPSVEESQAAPWII